MERTASQTENVRAQRDALEILRGLNKADRMKRTAQKWELQKQRMEAKQRRMERQQKRMERAAMQRAQAAASKPPVPKEERCQWKKPRCPNPRVKGLRFCFDHGLILYGRGLIAGRR